jgi:murein DD-endopeptidase MepM/ murein hydrolase activator NlpD
MRIYVCLLAIVFAFPALQSTVAAPVDPSIGRCTRKDDFAKRQEVLDPQVAQLSAEKDDAQREKLVAALAALADTDIEGLIRYREPCMAPVMAKIVQDSKKWFIRTRALYAIKMLGEQSAAGAAIAALGDEHGMVREAAANALGRLGGDAARDALQKRLETEQDPYVKATIEAAIELLDGKVKPITPDAPNAAWKEEIVGNPGARRVAFVWVNKGQTAFNIYDAKTLEYDTATKFVYPVQLYKEDLFAGYPRNSFGGASGHAGEDCAWFREGCSIYAIADGLVRMVQGAGGDWGFLVVIEHRLSDGQYLTSVYGHCAADVLVRPGQKVKAGQRIATQGLSCSVENGGYGSHLHFGIGHGPFRRPMGMAVGDKVNLSMPDGSTQAAPVVRIIYSDKNKNSLGMPMLAIIVKKPDGMGQIAEIPEQQLQQEVSWLQAYVKNCRGWLNPQALLPFLVEGKQPDQPPAAEPPKPPQN